MAFHKGLRVVRLCSDRSGRYVASNVWTIQKVARATGVITIEDDHGVSRFTYDLEGKQREPGAFRSEIVEFRD